MLPHDYGPLITEQNWSLILQMYLYLQELPNLGTHSMLKVYMLTVK